MGQSKERNSNEKSGFLKKLIICLLYTSDAADE